MAFLQVITRTFGARPTLLARNRASLAALEDADWEQTLVVDEVGRGCAWANANLATVPATGEYVWVLDDDDLCAEPALLAHLRRYAGAPVIVCRATHAVFGALPPASRWGGPPHLGACGWSNLFVRRDVWEAERGSLARYNVYEGDYRFAAHLWAAAQPWAWCDVVAAHYPRRSAGAAE